MTRTLPTRRAKSAHLEFGAWVGLRFWLRFFTVLFTSFSLIRGRYRRHLPNLIEGASDKPLTSSSSLGPGSAITRLPSVPFLLGCSARTVHVKYRLARDRLVVLLAVARKVTRSHSYLRQFRCESLGGDFSNPVRPVFQPKTDGERRN